MPADIFDSLFDVLESRKEGDPDSSYVASLYHEGLPKINQKVLEEAGELTEAAGIKENDQVIYEACDLLFHTFVLCSYKGVTLQDLRTELKKRFGISGVVEKNSRKKS